MWAICKVGQSKPKKMIVKTLERNIGKWLVDWVSRPNQIPKNKEKEPKYVYDSVVLETAWL